MNADLQWDDVKIFLSIARLETLTSAADSLEIGVATVVRRLLRLEASLGVKLFNRHQSGYRLTDDGTALLGKAEALERAGLSFGDAAQNQKTVTGLVRLATAENLATPLIIPAFAPLLRLYPKLRLDIVTDSNTLNLHRGDADLAVRMVKPKGGNLTLRRIGTLGFGLYGSASFLASRTDSPDHHDLDPEHLISWVKTYHHLPPARWLNRHLAGRLAKFSTNTLAAQLSATVAGIGLAVLPHFLARKHGMICVMPELGLDQTIWLVIRSDLLHSPRIRVVADFLVNLFNENSAELQSAQP